MPFGRGRSNAPVEFVSVSRDSFVVLAYVNAPASGVRATAATDGSIDRIRRRWQQGEAKVEERYVGIIDRNIALVRHEPRGGDADLVSPAGRATV